MCVLDHELMLDNFLITSSVRQTDLKSEIVIQKINPFCHECRIEKLLILSLKLHAVKPAWPKK